MESLFDEQPTLEVTNYRRPHGEAEQITMTKIRPEQVQFFQSNSIAVSMEDCGPFFALYADQGAEDVDDMDIDSTELTLIVKQGETCEDAMARLQQQCEKAVANGYWRPFK